MSLPDRAFSPEDYIAQRVEDQRKWYERKAETYNWYRWAIGAVVFGLTTAASGVNMLEPSCLAGTSMCMVESHITALSSSLTSVAVAVTGWATLNSTEYLANSYRSTAKQVRILLKDWYDGQVYAGADGFQKFVEDVEAVLAREHAAWGKHAIEIHKAPVAKAGAPASPPPVEEADPNEGEVGRVGGADDSFDPPVR